MKTFRQFQEESKGFGGEKKKKRKVKKRGYLSPRDAKLLDLKQRPSSWQGLESVQDPRTPKRYFVPRTVPKGKQIVDALSKGNDDSAVKMIKKELDMKIARKRKVRQSVMETANEIQKQVFGVV